MPPYHRIRISTQNKRKSNSMQIRNTKREGRSTDLKLHNLQCVCDLNPLLRSEEPQQRKGLQEPLRQCLLLLATAGKRENSYQSVSASLASRRTQRTFTSMCVSLPHVTRDTTHSHLWITMKRNIGPSIAHNNPSVRACTERCINQRTSADHTNQQNARQRDRQTDRETHSRQ